jgi:hypothetical protein
MLTAILLLLTLSVCVAAYAGGTPFQALSRTTFSNQNPQPNTAVGANALLTFLCPTGQTYLNSQFFFYVTEISAPSTTTQIIDDVAWIKLLVNGVQVSYATGRQWVMLANYYKNNIMIGNSGILPLMFERTWMQGLRSQRGPAYGMIGQNSFQIQVQFTSAPTTTGVILYHEIDPVASALGRHVEVRTQTHTFASTGQDNIIDLPQQDASPLPNAYVAMHLELLGTGGAATKADVTSIILQAEDTAILNSVVNIQENKYLFATQPRTPQTGYFAIDFDWRNRDDGQLWANMNKLVVQPTFSVAAGTYNIVMEILTGTPNTTAGT